MKRTLPATLLISALLISTSLAISTGLASTAMAQTEQKTLAMTIEVYVFPAQGQPPEQQNREEAECYAWSVNNTKVDPFDLKKQAEYQMMTAEQQKQQIEQAGKGAGAKGAVAGAAVGALIGEIGSHDAGGGAAAGAALGMVAARRKARRGKQKAQQQVDQQTQQVQQATAEQIEGFKKSFSLCLEAKSYLVKL